MWGLAVEFDRSMSVSEGRLLILLIMVKSKIGLYSTLISDCHKNTTGCFLERWCEHICQFKQKPQMVKSFKVNNCHSILISKTLPLGSNLVITHCTNSCLPHWVQIKSDSLVNVTFNKAEPLPNWALRVIMYRELLEKITSPVVLTELQKSSWHSMKGTSIWTKWTTVDWQLFPRSQYDVQLKNREYHCYSKGANAVAYL